MIQAGWHSYFTTYLVIRYPQFNADGSERMNVIYPLAYMKWDVTYRASQYVDGRGATSLVDSAIGYWQGLRITPRSLSGIESYPVTLARQAQGFGVSTMLPP
jgi:hypothetical protein